MSDLARVRRLYVPIGACLLLVAMLGLVLAAAGSTLGYDYRCYESAARNLLDGKPIYDNAFSINVGTCPGTYTYPPPFAVAIVPLLLLPSSAAAASWAFAMAACLLAGVALLPVRRDVRWLLVILAALDWPFLYSVKLGQVGPLLFLLFAVVWRWIDRPGVAGASIAAGALVKVQPGLLIVWAIGTRRTRTAVIAVAVIAAVATASMVAVGLGAWQAYLDLLTGLNGSLAADHNVAVGAVARHAGLDGGAATALQVGSAAAAVVALLAALRWAGPVAALQATIVASQLIASPLRDHYAVLLLLPTAWLVARGRTWAVLFPLAGWLSLPAGSTSGAWLAELTVPLSFFACLAVILVDGMVERRAAVQSSPPAGSGAAAAASSVPQAAAEHGAILRP